MGCGGAFLPRGLNVFILLLSKNDLKWLPTKDRHTEVNTVGAGGENQN